MTVKQRGSFFILELTVNDSKTKDHFAECLFIKHTYMKICELNFQNKEQIAVKMKFNSIFLVSLNEILKC